MSSALGMNLMPPTSAFQHGGSLQQPPNETPQPSENPTNNTNASELNNSSKDNHGKPKFLFLKICHTHILVCFLDLGNQHQWYH